MITAQEKQVLTNCLVRLSKVLEELIEQKNKEHQQVLNLIKGVLDQQHKLIEQQDKLLSELRGIKAGMG